MKHFLSYCFLIKFYELNLCKEVSVYKSNSNQNQQISIFAKILTHTQLSVTYSPSIRKSNINIHIVILNT